MAFVIHLAIMSILLACNMYAIKSTRKLLTLIRVIQIPRTMHHNTSERIKNELAGYVPKPCGQLLPCHFCKNRTCVVSTNLLFDFQTMIMMMVGICLFFCYDDIDGLTAEYFISEHFLFDPAGILWA